MAAPTGSCALQVVVADLDDGLPPGEPADVLRSNKFRDRKLDDAMIDRLAPEHLQLAVAAPR